MAHSRMLHDVANDSIGQKGTGRAKNKIARECADRQSWQLRTSAEGAPSSPLTSRGFGGGVGLRPTRTLHAGRLSKCDRRRRFIDDGPPSSNRRDRNGHYEARLSTRSSTRPAHRGSVAAASTVGGNRNCSRTVTGIRSHSRGTRYPTDRIPGDQLRRLRLFAARRPSRSRCAKSPPLSANNSERRARATWN